MAQVFPDIQGPVTDWRKFRPETLTVSPYPDLPITFTQASIKEEGKYVTWIGHNRGLPGASFVGVATAAGYDAIVTLPGAPQLSLHIRGDRVVVDAAVRSEEGCGEYPAQSPKPAVAAGPSILAIETSVPLAPETLPENAATPALLVDVLFAYDADSLAQAGQISSDPLGYLEGQTKAKLESANLTLIRSGVSAFAWRHLGLVAAPAFTQTGKSIDDINALGPGGALASWVRTNQYERGADQLMLLVGEPRDFGGRGYSPKQQPVRRERAVSTMKWNASYSTMAHELAHNFGCQHDRAHTEVLAPGEYGPPAPDNDGFYCYGLLWQNPPPPPGGGDTGTAGTIMSYADWDIHYFSNPDITVHVTGSLFGWPQDWELGTHQVGRAATDPKAAFNTRVLSEHAQAMSEISETITTPTITKHPASTTTTAGGLVLFSVTATGGGLSYQWLRGGTPIEGAVLSSFSRVAADTEPLGYSVVVTNRAGTVTSDIATITVSAPPPPPISNGSSGGGGGGTPTLWFYGALGLMLMLRAFLPRRT